MTERNLHACGIRKVGDLAALDGRSWKSASANGAWRWPGKARGEDAGGWFDREIGEGGDPKSISHEHTFIGGHRRRCSARRHAGAAVRDGRAAACAITRLYARTVQIKLRYSDFSTFTRSRTLDHATQIDTELAAAARDLFHKSWKRKPIRLLGVYAQSLEASEGQTSLLEEDKTKPGARLWRRWTRCATNMATASCRSPRA